MKTFCSHSLLGLEEVQFVLRSCSKSPQVSSSSVFYRMYLILFGIHTFLPTLHQLHRFCVSLSKVLQFLPFLLRYTRCLPLERETQNLWSWCNVGGIRGIRDAFPILIFNSSNSLSTLLLLMFYPWKVRL